MGMMDSIFGKDEKEREFDNKEVLHDGVIENYEDKLTYRDEFAHEDFRHEDELTDEERVRLHEERLRVGKDVVQTGEVKIDKDVVEERQEFDVPVSRDEVVIERRRVDEHVAGDVDFDTLDGDEIRIPLTEERIVVSKENVVAEELVIKKNRVHDVEHVSETVRKEVADVKDSTQTHDVDGFDRREDKDIF